VIASMSVRDRVAQLVGRCPGDYVPEEALNGRVSGAS
jgi:hypothetical protein